MSLVTDDINTLLLPRYLLNCKYPYPEGTQLEFKKTFHSPNLFNLSSLFDSVSR